MTRWQELFPLLASLHGAAGAVHDPRWTARCAPRGRHPLEQMQFEVPPSRQSLGAAWMAVASGGLQNLNHSQLLGARAPLVQALLHGPIETTQAQLLLEIERTLAQTPGQALSTLALAVEGSLLSSRLNVQGGVITSRSWEGYSASEQLRWQISQLWLQGQTVHVMRQGNLQGWMALAGQPLRVLQSEPNSAAPPWRSELCWEDLQTISLPWRIRRQRRRQVTTRMPDQFSAATFDAPSDALIAAMRSQISFTSWSNPLSSAQLTALVGHPGLRNVNRQGYAYGSKAAAERLADRLSQAREVDLSALEPAQVQQARELAGLDRRRQHRRIGSG